VRGLLRVVILGVTALALAVIGAIPPSQGVEVIGDDERDLYSGSGAVILPSAVSAHRRQQAASCPDCRWKVTMPCQTQDGFQDAVCRGFVLGCPQGREIKRAWLATPGRDFEPVGLFCPSDGEAVSVAQATQAVRGAFSRALPALRPVCEPPRGVVVGIPVHCRTGQPSAQVGWQDQLLGYAVTTSARASWSWNFVSATGQHVVVPSAIPGGAYPSPAVQHAFPVAGVNRVRVTATWAGRYFVDGLGPFPIEPNVTQQARIEVPTGSALGVVRP